MANLQGLKIPRGDRTDWPVLEYALIDYVESTLTELEAAREGQVDLATNLQDRYATKTYVQIAIGSPSPGDIDVTALDFPPGDAGKVGYSLQIVGGSLQFSNMYRASIGSASAPGYSFTNYSDAGMYLVESGTNTSINFSADGTRIGYFNYDTVTGAKSFVLDGSVADVTINNDGSIALQYVNAVGTSTFGVLNVTKLNATGTGTDKTRVEELFANVSIETFNLNASNAELDQVTVNNKLTAQGTDLNGTVLGDVYVQYQLEVDGTGADKTLIAELDAAIADVDKLSSTGAGANKTVLAELDAAIADVDKLSSTGTGANKTVLAELDAAIADVDKLSSTGTGANKTVLAELEVGDITINGNISSTLFITTNQTFYPLTEGDLRYYIAFFKAAFISDDVLVNIILPVGGITLTSDLEIGNAFGSNIRIKGNSMTSGDALRTNGFKLWVQGSLKAGCLDSLYIVAAGSTSVDPIQCQQGTLLLYAPIQIEHTATPYNAASAIKVYDEGSIHLICDGSTSPLTISNNMNLYGNSSGILLSQSQMFIYTLVDSVIPRTLSMTGVTYGIQVINNSVLTSTGLYTHLTQDNGGIVSPITYGVALYASNVGNIVWQGNVNSINSNGASTKGSAIVESLNNSMVTIFGTALSESRSLVSGIIANATSEVTILGITEVKYYTGLALSTNAAIYNYGNSSLYFGANLVIGMVTGTPAAVNRMSYGLNVAANSEVYVKGNTSITDIFNTAGIYIVTNSEGIFNDYAIASAMNITALASPNTATYGMFVEKGCVVDIATAGISTFTITNCTTGLYVGKMSYISTSLAGTYTGVVTDTSPAVNTVGNNNALITT